MKFKLLILLALFACLNSCGKTEEERKKFINTYKEVLVVREMEKDSLKANEKVKETLKKNGYDMNSFKKEFNEIAKDRESFVKIIDSVRGVAKREALYIKDTLDPFTKK